MTDQKVRDDSSGPTIEFQVQGVPAGMSAAEYAIVNGLEISGQRPRLLAYARRLWGRRDFIVTFSSARLAATYSTARLGQI
ncbi:MAG TPA: hypothetical protein VGF84_24700, partial [Micromonosporaceae bacterium]